MRTLILAALLALAVAPAALAVDEGPSPVDLAKAACKSEKVQMGKNTFTLTYPTSSASTATNACVAKRDGRAATDLQNGAKECKAERAAHPAAFTRSTARTRTAITRTASAFPARPAMRPSRRPRLA
jgi:hypothetical protein